MVEGRKRPRVSATQPPRGLIVQKFADSRGPELESLLSIVANRLNNNFRSCRNKRRRTTGYDNRVAKNRRKKRWKLGEIDEDNASALEKDQKKVPRRIRRRVELRKNLEAGFCTSGDGTKRLRTHLWHAKRFTMTKLWGFHLPLGLQGRGRGSRALLKWFRNGALIHDASYCCAVQLEGPEACISFFFDSLLSILRTVFVPIPSVHLEDISLSILSGVSYGSAMLHHIGAPVSQPIAPVNYMWRPFLRQNINIDMEDLTVDGYEKSQSSICSSSFRQLWVWIHASALNEGHEALKLACQKQMDETGVSINCFSLEGQLAKFEVMGFKAVQILQKILQPVSFISESSCQLKKCSTVEIDTEPQFQKSLFLHHEGQLPSHSILSLTVYDPRDVPEKGNGRVSEAISTRQGDNLLEDEVEEHSSLTECPNKDKELFSSLWLKPEENSIILSDSKDLWDAGGGMNPPVDENLLCMEKQQRRSAFFCLDNTSSGTLITESKERASRTCPILLLKSNSQRWSIILPLNWVKAFWVPTVSLGAHAIGLRELHWIACDVGLPYYPFGFPDCKAYSCFMATEAAASDRKADLRPLAMKPLRVPIPPPWDSVRFSFEKGSARVGDTHTRDEKICCGEVVPDNSLGDSKRPNCDLTSLDQNGYLFEGFVARTSIILSNYLKEIHGDHLLLYPNAPVGKMGFSKLMKDDGKLSQGPSPTVSNQIPVKRRLCFLRVLLHAYKEGVFEEGAVVCAPCLTDLSLGTSRSDDYDGLQIPQSSISSYFKLQPSGRWELQIPEDPVAMESHRWPIGFVTTGFVRGSKKPVAEALCEATLLAQLRGEQWDGMPEKRRRREIFVLVRNLRSAAYRLARSTIVLEQQKEDLEFI
ncbi:hypothetical protein HHK36_020892 [Tetracentron sinense]|uniref:Uncharacterized protein n=1 Tax=Tetracentron sinense TaxID=13715 RepID=A0A834YXV6_TETSI|nr:hypothetical protein HHK36_020892 [Tetracentron sinense]